MTKDEGVSSNIARTTLKAVVIVSLIILGVIGYFLYKWLKT